MYPATYADVTCNLLIQFKKELIATQRVCRNYSKMNYTVAEILSNYVLPVCKEILLIFIVSLQPIISQQKMSNSLN